MKFTIRGLDFIVDEIKSSNEVIIVVAALSPFIVFMLYVFYTVFSVPQSTRLCNLEEKYRNQESFGVISKVERKSHYHRLTYENSQEYVVPNSVLQPKHNALSIGDTLIKNSGSSQISIHPKNNGKRFHLYINFGCQENQAD
ncbi:hypothetical protein [Neolewinella litorea]|uniref:Uncharacterized protein n=1 Tax=Neolewinella litorea TaxID=2562452 RepID=A0A4S4N767_9BACT|nr:hypothetical protein [Neolewinella litorea]THH34355.1 hypothetical protein E4021_17735 [Neolewinella litorea]